MKRSGRAPGDRTLSHMENTPETTAPTTPAPNGPAPTSPETTAPTSPAPSTAGTALERMTEMQELLRAAQAEGEALAGLADRLSAHFARVDVLRDYLDRWMEDREEILAADRESGTDRTDLPILGEDPLWEAVEDASVLVRGLLTVCAAEVAAEGAAPTVAE